MPAKLKVFRTTIGFHDAYVAAPSRAAALRAWGSSTDLFGMGAAEQVTDEKLMAPALARPGEVVKLSRGSAAEQIDAAGQGTKPKKRPKVERGTASAPAPKPQPRPSRSRLEDAEKLLEQAEANHAAQQEAFEHEIAAIRKREDAARHSFDVRRAKLDATRNDESEAYEQAMTRWRES